MNKGFTLIESILVVAVFSLLVFITAPVYQSFQNNTELINVKRQSEELLNKARSYSISGKNDSSWGLKINEDNFILFQGDDYQNRNQDVDFNIDFSTAVIRHGINEIVFNKISGTTTATGTITFQSLNNRHKSLFINQNGLLDNIEADNHYLLVNKDNVSVGGTGNQFLQNITLKNSSSSQVTIDKVVVSWTKTGADLENVEINGSNVWTGSASSGEVLDITNTILTSNTSGISTEFDFDACVKDSTFNISFIILDGSQKETNTFNINDIC